MPNVEICLMKSQEIVQKKRRKLWKNRHYHSTLSNKKSMNIKKILWLGTIIIAGCESMADLAGYNSLTLNLKASESYNTLLSEASSQRILDTNSRTAQRVHQVFNRMVPAAASRLSSLLTQVARTVSPFCSSTCRKR